MWEEILEKVSHLKSLDKQYQSFGAETHRYQFLPCLSNVEIEETETRLNTPIPYALKKFYQEAGNGIAGPNYGLNSIAKLHGYHPGMPYTDVNTLREKANKENLSNNPDDYFEVSHEALSGLISIVDEGCGHEICMVTTGVRVGKIVYVSADGYVVETEDTLIDLYKEWLNREIEQFEFVKNLMISKTTFREIEEQMIAQYKVYNAGDIIVSLINIEKPSALFGSGGQKIFHGASQIPWYESVLKEWQNSNDTKSA